MIFKDKLDEKTKQLSSEIDRLLDLACERQNHIGDLLLFRVNGFYNESTLEWNKHQDKKFDPHVIGPGSEGHSEHAHYSFIHKYRTTNIVKLTLKEYLDVIKYTPEKSKQIDELVDIEETGIQIEMLIYIKFWEADLIIKKLYQFVRILNGEYYDWYFKIAESFRDSNNTGTRQDLIRLKIRERLKDISPILYSLIKDTYKTQIRNSIAHSNYSFLGRNIHLNNFIENDPHSQIRVLTFDEWIDIFHNTLVLHNEFIKIKNIINDRYSRLALQNDNLVPILVTEKDGKQYELPLIYRQEFNDWKFK